MALITQDHAARTRTSSGSLVEEQAHGLRGRNSQCSALALGGVRKAGLDVVARELREIGQQCVLRHSTSQVPQDVADRDASPTDARLSEPDRWVDADAIEQAHALSLRQVTRRQQSSLVRTRVTPSDWRYLAAACGYAILACACGYLKTLTVLRWRQLT